MPFRSHPDPAQWDDYVDYESTSWPKKEKRRYWIIPSICFNCESACGILAYVDKERLTVRKIEGNPVHPGSRGRTCAMGVVTPHQLEDPDRILYPPKGDGATLIVVDPRLSNTSAKANVWLPAYSGTEGALLLGMVHVLLREELYDREFVRTWVDWRGYLRAARPELAVTFDNFIAALRQ